MLTEIKYCYETLERKVGRLYEEAARMGRLQTPVFVSGRAGTGKGGLVRLLADAAIQKGGGLQVANCSALPDAILSREIFGYVRSDAGVVPGKIELSAGGVLSVEEIGEMSLALQELLLAALRTGRFCREGERETVAVRSRFVFTSSQTLSELVDDGRLVPGLADELSEQRLLIPQLSERTRDISILTDFFLSELAATEGRSLVFSPEVYHYLCLKPWEGNIRELRNYVTRLFYLTDRNVMTIRDVSEVENGQPRGKTRDSWLANFYPMPLHELEKRYILESMALNEGNKSRTARMLKISLKTLRNKLKEYEVPSGDMLN